MSHLSLPPPLDMPPMDDEMMEDLGFLDAQLVDPEMMKAAMGAGAGGAVGSVVFMLAVQNVKKSGVPFFNTPLKQGLLAAGLGLVGGRALWGKAGQMTRTRDMAKGLMGAMGGILASGIVTAVMAKIGTPVAGFSGFGQDEAETEAALASFGQSLPEEQALLNGMGQVDVEEQRGGVSGFEQVDVEEQRGGGVGSWIGY